MLKTEKCNWTSFVGYCETSVRFCFPSGLFLSFRTRAYKVSFWACNSFQEL